MSLPPPDPVATRILPDFLTQGDPALSFPHGKRYTPLHPKGVPINPAPPTDADAVRAWLKHVAAGRIGS